MIVVNQTESYPEIVEEKVTASSSLWTFVIQTAVGFIGLFGNTLVAISMKGWQSYQITTRDLLTFMALSHCLFFASIVVRNSLEFAGVDMRLICTTNLFVGVVTGGTSLGGMFLTSLECLLAVSCPTNFRKISTRTSVLLSIALTSVCLISLTGISIVAGPLPSDMTSCYFANGLFTPVSMILVLILVAFFLVGSGVVQIYTVILIRRRQRIVPAILPTYSSEITLPSQMSSALSSNASEPPVASLLSQRLRRVILVTTIMGITWAFFTICWLPFTIGNFVVAIYRMRSLVPPIGAEVLPIFSLPLMVNAMVHIAVHLVKNKPLRNMVSPCKRNQ